MSGAIEENRLSQMGATNTQLRQINKTLLKISGQLEKMTELLMKLCFPVNIIPVLWKPDISDVLTTGGSSTKEPAMPRAQDWNQEPK